MGFCFRVKEDSLTGVIFMFNITDDSQVLILWRMSLPGEDPYLFDRRVLNT